MRPRGSGVFTRRRWPPNTISASARMTQARMLATSHVSSLLPVRELGPLSTRMPITGASFAGDGGRPAAALERVLDRPALDKAADGPLTARGISITRRL